MTPKKAAVRPAGWGRRRRAGFYWRTSYDLRIESAGFGNDPTIPVASFFSRGLYHQPPAFSADGISAVFLGTYGKRRSSISSDMRTASIYRLNHFHFSKGSVFCFSFGGFAGAALNRAIL